MSKKEKLIRRLRSKPRDFTFDEADSLLRALGLKRSNKGRSSGSRVGYYKGDIKIHFHRPHKGNELLAYQIVDLLNDLKDGGLI